MKAALRRAAMLCSDVAFVLGGDGAGSFGELFFCAGPILKVVAIFPAALFVQLVGALSDLRLALLGFAEYSRLLAWISGHGTPRFVEFWQTYASFRSGSTAGVGAVAGATVQRPGAHRTDGYACK